MKKHLFIFICLICVISGNLFGQNKTTSATSSRTIDSLKLALKNAKNDTIKVQTLLAMGEFIYISKPDTALALWEKANALAEEKSANYAKKSRSYLVLRAGFANTLNNMGTIFHQQGNITKSLQYFEKSYKIQQEIGDKQGAASSMNNIAFIYQGQGNIPKAIEFNEKSLIIKEEIGDKSGIATTMNNLGRIYQYLGDIPKALKFLNNGLKIREEIGDKGGVANSLNNIALIYDDRGEAITALEYFGKSLKLREEIGDRNGIATSLNNMASLFTNQGNIPKALEYYNKSLKFRNENGDKKGVATVLNNVGLIYSNQGDPDKALENFTKSLKIWDERGLKAEKAKTLLNIGLVYYTQKKFDKALECYEESMKLQKEVGDNYGLSYSLLSIGRIYQKNEADIPKALEYFEKSLKLKEEVGDMKGTADALSSIGSIYFQQKNYTKALFFSNKSLTIGKTLGFPESIKFSADILYKIHKANGNHQLALENYEVFIKMRDSISNESTRKASIKSQLKYEYEKQAAADSVAHAKESEIKNVELEKQKTEISAKKNQQYALIIGLGLVIIFAGFMYNRFRVTQKQKEIIESQKLLVESQKNLVEAKQKEILDSIYYAKRIQMALVPSDKYIDKSLNKLQKRG